MATAPPSAKEKNNHTRLSRLVNDIGRRVMKDVFDSIHPPSSLHRVLNSGAVHSQLRNLRSRRVIFIQHWNLLYPISGTGTAESKNFDMRLLFLLLRNICGLKPPAKGWDTAPSPADKSMEADLVRIKRCRNELYARVEMALTDVEFDIKWDEIESALNRLAGSKYVLEIQRLKFWSTDPESEEYLHALMEVLEGKESIEKENPQKLQKKVDETLENYSAQESTTINLKGTVNLVASGGSVTPWTAGSAYLLKSHEVDDPEAEKRLVKKTILPDSLATDLTLYPSLEQGSFMIHKIISSLNDLEQLWKSYEAGDLEKKLEDSLVTQELYRLAPEDAKKVEISLKITEDEYEKARACLIKNASKNESSDVKPVMKSVATDTSEILLPKTSEKHKYTSWCSMDEKSNRQDNPKLFEKRVDDITNEKLENVAKRSRGFIDELKAGANKRRATVTSLRDLVDDLNSMSEGLIATATEAASAVGDVTTGQAMEDEAAIFNEKMKKSQTILNEDKEVMERVGNVYDELITDVENLSNYNTHLGPKDQIICSLLVADTFSYSMAESDASVASTVQVCTMVCTGGIKSSIGNEKPQISDTIEESMGPEIAVRLLPKMTSVFDIGVVKASENAAETVEARTSAVVVSTLVSVDINELVTKSISLNDGSKTQAATALQEILQRCEKQLEKIDQFIGELRYLAGELELALKEHIKNLLEAISCSNDVSDLDADQMKQYLTAAGTNTWRAAANRRVTNCNDFFLFMAHLFNYLRPKLQEYEQNRNPNDTIVDVTFLAHGGVRMPHIPCKLHNLNDKLIESITLYVPWGCNLDAKAAYGIATGRIEPAGNEGNEANENKAVYSGVPSEELLQEWNTLPKTNTMIPEVVFFPVSQIDPAYQHLQFIANAFQKDARGIFLPFLAESNGLDQIPLWALCVAMALYAWLFDESNPDRDSNPRRKYKIHIASCLFPINNAILRPSSKQPPEMWPEVNCDQYWIVPVKPVEAVTMTMNINPNRPELKNAFDALNSYFATRF